MESVAQFVLFRFGASCSASLQNRGRTDTGCHRRTAGSEQRCGLCQIALFHQHGHDSRRRLDWNFYHPGSDMDHIRRGFLSDREVNQNKGVEKL